MTHYSRDADPPRSWRLRRSIPVLTVQSVEDGLSQAKALVAGRPLGHRGHPADAERARRIAAIAQAVPDAVVGAGTIVSPEQIDEAIVPARAFW